MKSLLIFCLLLFLQNDNINFYEAKYPVQDSTICKRDSIRIKRAIGKAVKKTMKELRKQGFIVD